MKKAKEKKATCQVCGHRWKTISSFVYASCPSCLNKVKINSLKQTKLNNAGGKK